MRENKTNTLHSTAQASTSGYCLRELKRSSKMVYCLQFSFAFIVNDRARDPNKSGDESSSEYVLKSVQSMKESERTLLQANLREAEEVACSIIYNDGSSLLRPKKAQDVSSYLLLLLLLLNIVTAVVSLAVVIMDVVVAIAVVVVVVVVNNENNIACNLIPVLILYKYLL